MVEPFRTGSRRSGNFGIKILSLLVLNRRSRPNNSNVWKKLGTEVGVILTNKRENRYRRETQNKSIIRKDDNYRNEVVNQRPYLWNVRERSNSDPRRARWQDLLLLRRALPATISVNSRRR